jgi:hypothetical protein
LELSTRPAEKVLRELIGDLRLAGHQHFAFQEYNDPHGNRQFAGDANGSVSFQLAQTKIGIDKVAVSIVLYIDCTFPIPEWLWREDVELRMKRCRSCGKCAETMQNFSRSA